MVTAIRFFKAWQGKTLMGRGSLHWSRVYLWELASPQDTAPGTPTGQRLLDLSSLTKGTSWVVSVRKILIFVSSWACCFDVL